MDMFCSIGALDHICLSGLPEEKWEIPEAKAAMESGQIVYAGKYNAPDYELICSKECGLAIESTMIGHRLLYTSQLELCPMRRRVQIRNLSSEQKTA